MQLPARSTRGFLLGPVLLVLFFPSAFARESNPLGLAQRDFERLAAGGFGDSANSYVWSMTVFNGDLYVGTNRHHMWSILQSMPGMPPLPPGLGPAAPSDTTWGNAAWAEEFRGKIWRLCSGTWECVHQSAVVMNFGFRRLLSVDEDGLKGLVVGTANAFTGHPKGGCEILIGR